MRSILVSHPHSAQSAIETAAALLRHDRLACFVTGLAGAPDTFLGAPLEWAARYRPQLRNRILSRLDATHVRSLALVELWARALGGTARVCGLTHPNAYDAMFLMHDAAVAGSCWPRGIDAVYAYEDAARWTFARATRSGLERVWDLPSPYYATTERIWRDESARWPGAMGARPPIEPGWKRQRKDAELRLATLISVASVFTRSSLEALGVRVPIVVTPYGFPVEQFEVKSKTPGGKFTVLSVGTHDLRKGTPYLLEAWKKAGLTDACLRLVGPMRLSKSFLRPYAGLYEHVPHMARSMLGEEYRAADLLAFPTLGDGFGLVIQEAMCCGTPVVTTRCGGGPECITDGVDGWIIPERDVDALVEKFRWASASRDALYRIGRAARARAESWTWQAAGRALVQALGSR
jgi:starch synthase